MRSVFNNKGTLFVDGFLVMAEFEEKEWGTVRVYQFSSLYLEEVTGNSIFCRMHEVKKVEAAQEPFDMSDEDRELQPYKRTEPYTYMAHSFYDLKAIRTKNSSRFLITKKPWHYEDVTPAVNNNPDEIAEVCINKEELKQELGIALARIGVPKEDIEEIRTHILNMF